MIRLMTSMGSFRIERKYVRGNDSRNRRHV